MPMAFYQKASQQQSSGGQRSDYTIDAAKINYYFHPGNPKIQNITHKDFLNIYLTDDLLRILHN